MAGAPYYADTKTASPQQIGQAVERLLALLSILIGSRSSVLRDITLKSNPIYGLDIGRKPWLNAVLQLAPASIVLRPDVALVAARRLWETKL
jgi:hypothetical protein